MVIGLSLLFENQVLAQDQANVAAQANNPLANMTAFNMQNYHIGDLNVFAAYWIDTSNPTVSFGFGPQLTTPTASKGKLANRNISLVLTALTKLVSAQLTRRNA